MNTTNTSVAQTTLTRQKNTPAFNLPEGPVFNEITGEYDIYHLGECIGLASTEGQATRSYHEYLDNSHDHIRRNPANGDIPVFANGQLAATITADWEVCQDCGRCVDVGEACSCQQPQLCDDGYTINFNGEPCYPPEPLHEYDEYGLEVLA